MLQPISARLASSCSRNGMREADTEIICCGDTSMYLTSLACLNTDSPCSRQGIRSEVKRPSLSIGALACAMMYEPSSTADRYSKSSVTFPSTTRRYGVSRKPYSLQRENTDSELIRPMFGPSGVSIGHRRP